MDALVAYINEHGIRTSLRSNVCSTPVSTVTLGIVDKRGEGLGISVATFEDHFELLRLGHAVAADPQLEGQAPMFYTSICINANFGSVLHVDRHNEGVSHIVAGGNYSGGALFVMQDDADCHETFEADTDIGSWSIAAGDVVRGRTHNIKHRWLQFDGNSPHGVCSFDGTRVSIVFFCVPLAKISPRDKKVLAALGFPSPPQLAPLVPSLAWELPFRVFICSTRRASTIMSDTLNVLAREGVPLSAVTICVRDNADVEAYEPLGLNMCVQEDNSTAMGGGGLPEQRKHCLRGRPHGSWNLFLDDDLKSILRLERYSHMSLAHIVIYAFSLCRARQYKSVGSEHKLRPAELARYCL